MSSGVKFVKPVLQALLVADHVYEDKATGKRIVAGIFDKLSIQRIDPTEVIRDQGGEKRLVAGGTNPGSPSAYISLTSIHGSQGFLVRYVYLNEDRVLFHTGFRVECPDPLQTVQIVLPLPTLPIIGAGAYALELLCDDDDPIGAFRILVEESAGLTSHE